MSRIPLWVIPVLICFSVGTVWLRLSIIRTTYSIHETDSAIEKTLREREVAQLKLTALRSPRRLEELARQKFGLSRPSSQQVIYLRKASLDPNGR